MENGNKKEIEELKRRVNELEIEYRGLSKEKHLSGQKSKI